MFFSWLPVPLQPYHQDRLGFAYSFSSYYYFISFDSNKVDMTLEVIGYLNSLSEQQVKLLRYLNPMPRTTYHICKILGLYKNKASFYRSVKLLIGVKLVKKTKIPKREKKPLRVKDILDSNKILARKYPDIENPSEKEQIRNLRLRLKEIGIKITGKKRDIIFHKVPGSLYFSLTRRGEKLLELLENPDNRVVSVIR